MQSYSKKIQPDPSRPDGTHLWLVLWKAYSSVRAYAVKNIATLGLSFSDFAILEVLLHRGPLPVNDIGEKVQLTSGSITLAVDRLEARKMVERRSHATDRRTRVVHLTDGGRVAIEKAFACHSAAMNRLESFGSEEERVQLIDMLKRLGWVASVLAKEERK